MYRKRRKRGVLVPVAAMADIAFLLIIFFMVTTNFMKEAHVALEEAAAPEVEPVKEASVSVAMDNEGQLWLQGEPCNAEMLESAVAAILEGRDDKLIMLKIDRRMPHEKYGPVLLALSRAEVEIALVGVRSEE